MTTLRAARSAPLLGQLRVDGDKSISHRALMLGGLAEGSTRISGLLQGEDVVATAHAMMALGASIDGLQEAECHVRGGIQQGPSSPVPIDVGNSGTGMRLLCGLAVGRRIAVRLSGDASLSRRPMQRIIDPLQQMGAQIRSRQGCPPLEVAGERALRGIDYVSPMASAQVKSALLLAGLGATGVTRVREPHPSRDHSERMLTAFGCPVIRDGDWVGVEGGQVLQGTEVRIPADISSAAFFIVAASIVPGSAIRLSDVGINPLRSGVVDILQAMGADIKLENQRDFCGEPVADIGVNYAPLKGIDIPPEWVARAIDEFPVLFVAAACAEGRTVVSGASELRLKESDRIAVMCRALDQLGIVTEERSDGATIEGGVLRGGRVDAAGDHRCAMSLLIAGAVAANPIVVDGCTHIATSYPRFVEHARHLGYRLEHA